MIPIYECTIYRTALNEIDARFLKYEVFYTTIILEEFSLPRLILNFPLTYFIWSLILFALKITPLLYIFQTTPLNSL